MAQRSLYDLINGEFASGNPNLAVNVANPDAVIARQRFVYDGSGKSVPSSVWTLSSGGTGTVTMDFNGLKLTSSAGDKRIGCGEKAQPEGRRRLLSVRGRRIQGKARRRLRRCGGVEPELLQDHNVRRRRLGLH